MPDKNEPAFPTSVSAAPNGDVYEGAYTGMSLRDYFAAKALGGMFANQYQDQDQYADQRTVERAYQVADAMLAEREKESK